MSYLSKNHEGLDAPEMTTVQEQISMNLEAMESLAQEILAYVKEVREQLEKLDDKMIDPETGQII